MSAMYPISSTEPGVFSGAPTAAKRKGGARKGAPSKLKGRKRFWFSTSRAKSAPDDTKFFTVAFDDAEAARLASTQHAVGRASGGKVWPCSPPKRA